MSSEEERRREMASSFGSTGTLHFPVSSEGINRRERRERGEESGSSGGFWAFGDLFNGAAVSDGAMLILLAILVLAGVAVLVYFIAIVLANFLSFGEVHRASVYCKKVKRYSIGEEKGCNLARRLTRMSAYFSVILFVFTAEEAIRYVLHTGPATIEIWWFRIACLIVFIVIFGNFLLRLSRWVGFKSTPSYLKTSDEIRQYENKPMYHGK